MQNLVVADPKRSLAIIPQIQSGFLSEVPLCCNSLLPEVNNVRRDTGNGTVADSEKSGN
jgi:hypothetical protein